MRPTPRFPQSGICLGVALVLAGAGLQAAPGPSLFPERQGPRLAPVPGDQDEAAELVALCEKFLDAYSNGRWDAVETMFTSNAVVAMDLIANDQQRVSTAAAFVDRTRRSLGDGSGFREWISGEPIVLIDNKIAMVWAPFEIESNGRKSTGIDTWQFVKIGGEWRVFSLAFTNRPMGRNEEEVANDVVS